MGGGGGGGGHKNVFGLASCHNLTFADKKFAPRAIGSKIFMLGIAYSLLPSTRKQNLPRSHKK